MQWHRAAPEVTFTTSGHVHGSDSLHAPGHLKVGRFPDLPFVQQPCLHGNGLCQLMVSKKKYSTKVARVQLAHPNLNSPPSLTWHQNPDGFAGQQDLRWRQRALRSPLFPRRGQTRLSTHNASMHAATLVCGVVKRISVMLATRCS